MRKMGTWGVLIFVAVAVPSIPAVAADGGWPSLRGPDFDGAARNAQLLRGGAAGLAVGWKRALGTGYSAVAVADGRAVTMFAEGGQDVLAAFDLESGDELWRHPIAEMHAGHSGSHDGPISTPLLAGGRVHALGPRGHLVTVDAATGKEIWATHLVDDLGSEPPFYGFATSPILVDGVLVLEIGAGEGKAIAGFDPATGKVLWTAGDDAIAYHSPIAATVGGQLQVVAAGNKTLYGIDARSGEIRWTHEHGGTGRGTGADTIIPLPAGDGRFLLQNKTDGSTMVQVARGTEVDYEVKELWTNNTFRGTYVTPVYRDGFLYGMSGRIFTCVDAASGETRWRSREPGDGFPTLVGDQMVVITKPGSLHVVEASPDGYQELARLDLFQEHSWSQVAYADGHLYARSMEHLARVDLASQARTAIAGHSAPAGTRFARFLEEVAAASDKGAAVDAFLEHQRSFPIIEPPDIVHFVFRAEAEDVGIVGDMLGARREEPMARVEGTDLFHYTARLEPNASMTYGFIKDYGDPIADPLNPRPGNGVFDDVSWFSMPAWEPPAFDAGHETDRSGRMETVEWDSKVREDSKRTAQVYLPAGYDDDPERRYPALYVYGGKDALEDGAMRNALDQLLGKSVEPLIAVFVISPEDGGGRDLGGADSYNEMVATELVPLIDAKFRTVAEARSRATMGTATAGAVALYGSLKHPDVFGRVGSQSAVWFIGTDTPIREMIPDAKEQGVTVFLEWGTYDLRSPHENWDMARENREIWSLLRERGHRPAGGEVPEGFDWSCWRAHTHQMLAALFPLVPGSV